MNKLQFTVAALTLVLLPIIGHEMVHKDVAESYGCEASINPIPDLEEGYFMATAYDCSSLSESQRYAHFQTQQTVETSGYQIILVSVPISLLALMILYRLDQLNTRFQALHSEVKIQNFTDQSIKNGEQK